MTASSDTVSVFVVPSYNLGKLDALLVKLGRRATKLGLIPPSYTVIKEETKTVNVVIDDEKVEKVILLSHLVVNNPLVVVADHEFIATLEHTEEGNVVHAIRGKEVPRQYLNCDSWCVHCKTSRYRKETFIVRHIPSGEYKQIGRNCLADYLGRDAERYAVMAELWQDVSEACSAAENDSDGSYGGSGNLLDYLETYLGFVAECISRWGWCSKAMASIDEKKTATATEAVSHMHRPPFGGPYHFRTPSDESKETAKKAIEWCESLSDEETENNNYLHNIRVIARRGVVGNRQYGLAASIVAGYHRHLSKLRRQEQSAKSNYVGTVGEKGIYSLFIDKVVEMAGFATYYGSSTVYLHIMSDNEGNIFTWKSSAGALDTAKEYLLKGTIKEHKEYRGARQTVLTRCATVEYKTYIVTVGATEHTFSAISEADVKNQLRIALNVKKLPRGVKIVEKVATSAT